MNNSYVDNNTNIFHQRSLLWETKQLDLFALILEQEDQPPYPLQIICIPHDARINPDFGQLLKAIGDRQLTISLEILESLGIEGEQALNFIAKFRQIDWSQSPYSEEVAL